MTSLHPLALRILAAAGAGTASAAFLGAFSTVQLGCCPPPEDTGPYEDSLNESCTVTLPSSFDVLSERCVVLEVEECPAADQLGAQFFEAVCGPLRPGAPVPLETGATTSGGGGAGGSELMGGAGAGGAGGSSGAGAGGVGGNGGSTANMGLNCCYGTVDRFENRQACGRPFLVDGQALTSAPVAREDWCGVQPMVADCSGLTDDLRATLAERWARDAALEHASVASFARFALDLLTVGAPADLVRGAQQAMRDEIDHAERCYALAARYGGAPIGPGELPIKDVSLGGGLLEVARRALVEGCIGETIAALTAQRTREHTRDEQAVRTLEMIARDEATHAELAFRFVAWAAREPAVREGLRRALPAALWQASTGAACAPALAFDARLGEHGQPSAALRVLAAREALEQVITPCYAALLAEPAAHALECHEA
jgi:hypothetical protein